MPCPAHCINAVAKPAVMDENKIVAAGRLQMVLCRQSEGVVFAGTMVLLSIYS